MATSGWALPSEAMTIQSSTGSEIQRVGVLQESLSTRWSRCEMKKGARGRGSSTEAGLQSLEAKLYLSQLERRRSIAHMRSSARTTKNSASTK